jgi:hypothetical protein
VTRSAASAPQVLVRFGRGIALRVPLRATQLSPCARDEPRAKLCCTAVKELLALVKEYELCPRRPETSGADSRQRSSKKPSKS